MLNVGGEKLNESVFVQTFLKFCKDINFPVADFTATESFRLYNFKAFIDEFGGEYICLAQFLKKFKVA